MKLLSSLLATLTMGFLLVTPAAAKSWQLASPDGRLVATIDDTHGITYAVAYDGRKLIIPSPISMTIGKDKTTLIGTSLKGGRVESHKSTIQALFYKKSVVEDNYNTITFQLNDRFCLIFRAYNEGIAYRFVANRKTDFIVQSEQATFNFAKNWKVYLPYANASGTIDEQFHNSGENTYTYTELSRTNPKQIAFLPLIVEADEGVKVVIAESDLESYPGLYVLNNGVGFKGVLPGYPTKIEPGRNNTELLVKGHEPYLAKARATQSFPWRIIGVANNAGDLLTDDMVYRLASPSRLKDTSWIYPGKVAWEWWNECGVYNVPFRAGVNTETYKYYIDFASRHGIEYVILDGGWSVPLKADLFQVIPSIDLPQIVSYGKEKGVGIILWSGFCAFERDTERVCRYYSEMGVKGFKVDFIDRDDQMAVEFLYRAAAIAARYKLIIDYHGVYKPTGLNRTYPNVVNFEAVAGQEQNKWSTIETYDQVRYDVIMPFARMYAGGVDYTQGAMRNGTRRTYHMDSTEPMSQGTRTHQLAQYAVFFSPLNMLCDSPTHYEENPCCTDFITRFPVVWDETRALQSEIGEYVAVARRSGNHWYVGVLSNWTARDLILDLSPLHLEGRSAQTASDGPSADRLAADHLHQRITIPEDGKIKIHLAPGGGYALQTL